MGRFWRRDRAEPERSAGKAENEDLSVVLSYEELLLHARARGGTTGDVDGEFAHRAMDGRTTWMCCKGVGGDLLGLRVHEANPASSVQRTAFRSRDHHLVRSLVSPVWA